jgi:hypothetical protein
MNRDMKFSEMMYGNVKAGKQQETTLRMIRMGKTELTILDTYKYLYAYDHNQQAYLTPFASGLPAMSFFRSEMGYGKGMQAKRQMATRITVLKAIDAANPALAAEQRCIERGSELMAVALLEQRERDQQSLREWRRLNWSLYWGRGFENG